MGIFDSLKKSLGLNSDEGTILKAPLTGKIIPIEDVPDPVFADKVVGDGLAIDPTGNVMVAPCDGVIGKIFETNHAFSMETPSGVELFVHFGIDTVELKGEGFKRIAKEGQQIKTGDPVVEVDLTLLKEKARSVVTPIVISNMDDVSHLDKSSGSVQAGADTLLTVYMK
ncbi:PTS glucose transporter subunit IIA [Endozoicomonas sp. SCSIO W0465]|uniref:PTS glucose transporter subunit IIA n=1 Tax=Endozoicomonas sp. SCSIO W0465 TaxID=2918516 RepID=UPI00207614D1|nr:PTS glucose transporter subunit IIA [Endozoicomonas sp. SCSIO W0465]USE35649.1 PTS glucose transporter subunit IIA [Endozoicomonas sp. SCSIO W0465]